MRYKKTVAVILVTGMVVATLGGIVALFVVNRQSAPDTPDTEETHTEEVGTRTPLPGVSHKPSHEPTTTPETAEEVLDVDRIERETGPEVVGGEVEYDTKLSSKPIIDLDEGNEVYLESGVIAVLTEMEAEGQEVLVNEILDGEILLINHFVRLGYSQVAIHQMQRFYYDFFDQLRGVSIDTVIEQIAACIPQNGASLEGFAQLVQATFGWGGEWSYAYVIYGEESA